MLVVSSCTGDKAVKSDHQLQQRDFASDEILLKRERELHSLMRPAAAMYTGEQHTKMMHGVRILRQQYGGEAVDLKIVSAGYGLIEEHRPIAPYDVTFNAMRWPEIDSWSRHLGINRNLRASMIGYPLVVVLLGDRYLRAAGPLAPSDSGQKIVLLGSTKRHTQQRGFQTVVVPAGTQQCKVYGSGTIALKGRMFYLLAKALVREGMGLVTALMADKTPRTIEDALLRSLRS